MRLTLSTKGVLCAAVGILLLAGCAKENPDTLGRADGKARISFSAPIIAEQATTQQATQRAGAQASQPIGEERTTGAQPATRAALTQNTTVRVVAYIAGSMDYKADQAYYVDSDNKLKPCTVKSDGSFEAVDMTNELALIPDTYDFYAITPALPLNADNKTVNVPNGVDYASSVTANISVTNDNTIALTELARKCSKIALIIEKAADNTEMTELSVVGNGVTISALRAAASNTQLNTDIPAASGTATLNILPASFTLNGTTSTATTYLLPRLGTDRIALAYDLTYKASNITESKTFNGTMGNIVLEKGKSYTFTLTIRKTGATISVKDWIDGGSQDVGMSTVDYTDNNKGLFLTTASDVYNPWYLTGDNPNKYVTTMNWYIASGTYNAESNARTLTACPDGWSAPSKDDMHLMWIYKGAFPDKTKLSGIYWPSTASPSDLTMAWFSDQDNGSSYGATKKTTYNVRCIRNAAMSGKKYPYVDFNAEGQKCVIVSRDAEGGVRAGGVLTDAEISHLNTRQLAPYNELSTYNKVAPRFEVAQTNAGTNVTWASWMNGAGTGNDGSGCPAGWRMPTQREMMLIMNMAFRNEIPTSLNIVSGSGSTYYMCSTESSANSANTWSFSASLCHTDNKQPKTNTFAYARCVRDVGTAEPFDYTDNAKAWFSIALGDARNPITQGATMNWFVANGVYDAQYNPGTVKACPNGWVLPTLAEQLIITAYMRSVPNLNFKPGSYWVSTITTPEKYWLITYPKMLTYDDAASLENNVRCIRKRPTVGTVYPYVIDGKIIVSRDENGGVRSDAIHPNWSNSSLMPEHDDQSTYNSVAAKFEVSADISAVGVTGLVAKTSCPEGWRLPTQREMMLIWSMLTTDKLTVFSKPTPPGGLFYWSGTAGNIGTTRRYMDFYNGNTGSHPESNLYNVRCVRDL